MIGHQLNTIDVASAHDYYSRAFDAFPIDRVVFTGLARTQPGVHVAWRLRAAGGFVAGVFDLPDHGGRLAVCDDPRGAFVGFRAETARSSS